MYRRMISLILLLALCAPCAMAAGASDAAPASLRDFFQRDQEEPAATPTPDPASGPLSLWDFFSPGRDTQDAAPTHTPAPESTPAPLPTPDSSMLFGAWLDDTYTNDFAQLSFTLPSGWYALDDEEIEWYVDWGIGELVGSGAFYDAMVMDSDWYDLITVLFEPIDKNHSWMTESTYLSMLSISLGAIYPELECSDPAPTLLGDQQYTMMEGIERSGNVRIRYYVRQKESYMICVLLHMDLGDNQDADRVMEIFEKEAVGRRAAFDRTQARRTPG